jgi:chromosome partitioning protein
MGQGRIAIMSNAGGTGKTTLAANIAYQLARLGKSVCIVGCDPNGSLALFVGLEDPVDKIETLDKVLDSNFSGDWPLFPVWRDKVNSVDAILGGLHLFETTKRLDQDPRGAYLLSDALEDHPLPHDYLLFDCPGTVERYHEVALCGCSHILVALRPEYKDVDAGFKLINWIYDWQKRLRLKPARKILGVVINGFDRNTAMHREIMGDDPDYSLPMALEGMDLALLKSLPFSRQLRNSSANGVPLGLWRPGDDINNQFRDIAQRIVEEVENA